MANLKRTLNRYEGMRFFLFLVILLSLSFISRGQGTDDDSERGSMPDVSVSVPKLFGESMYTDQVGIMLSQNMFSYESGINLEDYMLGPMDLISIDIKGGQSMLLRGVVINVQGDIVLPTLGHVTIGGLTVSEARQVIENSFQEKFKEADVKITLDQPRPHHIHVTGEIPYPGIYRILAKTRIDRAILPALTTGKTSEKLEDFNSISYDRGLFTGSNYSLRNIIIHRKDSTQQYADLVRYMKTGDLEANPFVDDGDVIVIQQNDNESPRISVSGAVKQELELEYNRFDTPATLIEMAGGYRVDANSNGLRLYRRTVSGVEKITVDAEDLDVLQLKPNDRLVVPYERDARRAESAWIEGEAVMPGNYPIVEGETTLFELLEMSGGLTNRALKEGAYLVRTNRKGKVISNEINEQLLKRASDQVMEGFEYLELETNVSEGRVYVDLRDDNQLKNVTLIDGDRLLIPRDDQTVFVFGQVNNPGYYAYNETGNDDVTDYIDRAGGMSIAADMDRVFVIKAGSKAWKPANEAFVRSGDMIFVDRVPFESIAEKRAYDLQKRQQRNSNIQLIMAGITTITGIITTAVAIRNAR